MSLKGCKICVSGTLSMTRAEFEKLIKDNGGTISKSVTKTTTHLVTTKEDYDHSTSKIEKAKEYGIFIVDEDFVHMSIEQDEKVDENDYLIDKSSSTSTTKKKRKHDDSSDTTSSPPKKKKKEEKSSDAVVWEFEGDTEGKWVRYDDATIKAIEAEYQKDNKGSYTYTAPNGQEYCITFSDMQQMNTKTKYKRDVRRRTLESTKEDDGKGKMKKFVVKGKAAVEPESGYADSGRIYEEGDDVYAVMLNQTDVSYGTYGHNKFYQIQLIELEGSKNYVVYTRWGRVGAARCQSATKKFSNISAAKKEFCKKFRDKTANEWEDRKDFEPVKGKYIIVDIDYNAEDKEEEEEETKKTIPASKLDKRVQELIKLISNVKLMQETMKEYQIDLKKMPLGKLSKKQINEGYKVLTQIQEAIKSGASRSELADLSSDFYSLVPHDFGRRRPTIIDNEIMLKAKMEMLETLGDLEIATKLLSETKKQAINPIDAAYNSLNTELVPLEKDSEEYKLVEKYVKNTHAPTHNNYKLKLLDVFTVKRMGEAERYQKYANLHNRRLLWHGSRTTNWMGILSQGLRIAPPEAPVTGYMFGKGVYFADLVSKSANYCFTNKQNNIGCMVLAEVALGNMYKREHAQYITKLKSGYHSTFGMGKTGPDPKETVKLYVMKKLISYVARPNGCEVWLGKPVDQPEVSPSTSLLYNEFIVYDVAQINIKYLLKLQFDFK